MKINNIILFIIILCIQNTTIYSQTFVDAKYIDYNDTEFEGKINTQSLNFKKNIKFYHRKENEFTELNPYNVKEIIISDFGRYVSNIIEGSFIEMLVVGEASLYKNDKEFVLTKNGTVYNLRNSGLQWRGILQLIVSDCTKEKLYSEKTLRFDKEEIMKIIEKYNLCKDNLISKSLIGNKKNKMSFGPQIGAVLSFMSFFPKNYILPGIKYKFGQPYSYSPTFGVRFASEGKGKGRNYSFEISPFFTVENYNSTAVYEDANYLVDIKSNIISNTIFIPISLNYKYFESTKQKLYWNFGLGPKFNANKNFNAQYDENFKGTNFNTQYEENRLSDLRDFQVFGSIGHSLSQKIKSGDIGIALNAFFMTKHTIINLRGLVTSINLSTSYNFTN